MYNQDPEAETKLTSVKLIEDEYTKFQQESVGTDFTLQKLVNRCLYKFNSDDDFKNQLREEKTLNEASGSKW